MMVTGSTKISDRMTWKQLQHCVRDPSEDFTRPLAQNFLLLHQAAKNKKPLIPPKYTDEDSSNLVVTVRAEPNRLDPIRLK